MLCNNRQTDHIYMKLTFTCGGPSVTPMLGWLPSWLVGAPITGRLFMRYPYGPWPPPIWPPKGNDGTMHQLAITTLHTACLLVAQAGSFCHNDKRLIKSITHKVGDETTFQINQESPIG